MDPEYSDQLQPSQEKWAYHTTIYELPPGPGSLVIATHAVSGGEAMTGVVPDSVPFTIEGAARGGDECESSSGYGPESIHDTEPPDQIDHYLRQLGETPLLTGERERELALSIEEARRELRGPGWADILPAELPERIEKAKQQYIEARNLLVTANLRLVVAVAKRYVHRGLSFIDLVQEGNLGLMKAAEKFDCRGCRFSTYAVWWIRQAVTSAIAEQARTIRIPASMTETADRVARTARELAQVFGREPSFDEIGGKTGLPPEKIRRILCIPREPVRLSTAAVDQNPLVFDLQDANVAAPQDAALRSDLAEHLDKALSSLTSREQTVIRMRFGIGKAQHTLQEMAKIFGVSRERVRQIEASALRKLRRRARGLEAHLSGWTMAGAALLPLFFSFSS